MSGGVVVAASLPRYRVETVNVRAFDSQALAELGYSHVVEGVGSSGYCAQQFADEQEAWDYLKDSRGHL